MPATKEQTEEHPIIFSGWSIRRIFADEKRQTRRIVKGYDQMLELSGGNWPWAETPDGEGYMLDCPYGATGDMLWVREAFRLPADADGNEPPKEYVERGANSVYWEATDDNSFGKPGVGWGRKRPSIFMPRELCRLRLRVEDVRVERLQEISPDDVLAEGWSPSVAFSQEKAIQSKPTVMDALKRSERERYDCAFAQKWRDIHGDGAWDENPSVWVVAFSRIDTE